MVYRRQHCGADHGSLWWRAVDVAVAVRQAVLRQWCLRLRKACRDDRAAHLSQLADRISTGPAGEVFQSLHALLGHRRKKPYCPEPLPALKLSDGTPCADGDAILARWRQHFGALEAGRQLSLSAFVEEAASAIQSSRPIALSWPQPDSILDLPTEADVQRLLATAKAGKAPGPDGIPAEFGRKFAKYLAPHLHRIVLKTTLRGSEPIGLKSGQAIWFYKGKGAMDSCSSYRAILLLPSWGKVLHQATRPALKRHFQESSPDLQLGGKTGISVVFGSHLIRGAARYAASSGRTHFTLFTDIASAFYTVIQQLVATRCPTADVDAALQQATQGLRLSADEADALQRHLLEPTAMSASGASAWLEALTARYQEGNFFMLRGDETVVATARGSRPGSSWADLVFAEVMTRVLKRRDELRNEGPPHSEAVVLPWDGDKTLEPVDQAKGVVSLDNVVWADDVAIPRVTTPACAAAALAFETSCLVDSFREFGFSLAFGPHKTAGVLTLAGAGSRAAKQQVFGLSGLRGQIPVILEAGGVSLPLVASYRHLGSQQCPAGRLGPELRYRIAQARASFSEGRRKVYKTTSITVRRKAHILAATALAKLFHGAGSWGPLTKGEHRLLTGAIWNLYLDAYSCLALLDMPSPAVWLRFHRLLYLGQLATSGPPALWAVLRADRAHASLLLDDLLWLHSWTWSTSSLPHPVHEWSAWLTFMQAHPRRYKGLIKRARALEGCRNQVVAALTCLHRSLLVVGGHPPAADADATSWCEVCIPCRRAFPTRRSWAGHSARKHGYRCHAFLCAEDTTCQACGKRFASVGRLRRHLVAQTGCVEAWGSFTPARAEHARMHTQALPEVVAGFWDEAGCSGIRTDVSVGLLDALLSADPADAESVWSIVSEYVEPLAVLRATVEEWKASQPSCLFKTGTADNILLLLDVDLLADTKQPLPTSHVPFNEEAPAWPLPGGIPLVCGFPRRTLPLASPPARVLSPWTPTSMRLQDAVAYSFWLEAACTVCARLVELSKSQPGCIPCPGVEAALGPAAGWMRAAGFIVEADGVATPA